MTFVHNVTELRHAGLAAAFGEVVPPIGRISSPKPGNRAQPRSRTVS